jgi:hypothetical protein
MRRDLVYMPTPLRRLGFNYREGVVLHDVRLCERPVMHRLSLVEMAVRGASGETPRCPCAAQGPQQAVTMGMHIVS